MPNWVYNTLTINKKDKDFVLDADGNVDFNIIKPMPDTIRKTISPARTETIYLYLSEKDTVTVSKDLLAKYEIDEKSIERARKILNDYTPHESEFGPYNDRKKLTHDEYVDESYELGKRYVLNKDNYGVYDWYEWSYRNWGVKWNASDSDWYAYEDYLNIRFDTPWGYPDEWLKALKEKCPFHLAWEEEQGYRGVVYTLCEEDERYICSEDMEMLEWVENEDGDCETVDNGNYGECWQEYCLNAVFKKGE